MSEKRPSLACPVGIDDTFGPWAGPNCRGGFDFTLLFEETIFCIPLQCLLLLILPLRVWQLTHTDAKILPGVLRPLKVVRILPLLKTAR
jgi:ATP-binding cassette subfamily C (CFTR/MRP) protein 1